MSGGYIYTNTTITTVTQTPMILKVPLHPYMCEVQKSKGYQI